MRSKRTWFGIAASLLAAAGIAIAAGGKGYSGSIVYKVTDEGKTDAKTGAKTGVGAKGVFSGRLAVGRSALLSAYAAAANIPVSDIVKGGRYAVKWSMAKGTIHGTALAKFKAAGAGSVCVTYVATPTQFDENFNVTLPHGTFKTIGGTGKGARTAASGTFKVGKEKYSGKENRTTSVTGTMKTTAVAKRPLSATCQKLAKSAR